MGKASVVKKPAASVKISTALFHRTSKNSIAAITTTRNTNNSLAAASSAPATPLLRKTVNRTGGNKGKAQPAKSRLAPSRTGAKGKPPLKDRLSKGSTSTSNAKTVSSSNNKPTKAKPGASTRSTSSVQGSRNPDRGTRTRLTQVRRSTSSNPGKAPEKSSSGGAGVKAVKGRPRDSQATTTTSQPAKPVAAAVKPEIHRRSRSSVSSRRSSVPSAPSPTRSRTRHGKETKDSIDTRSSSPKKEKEAAASDKSKSKSPSPKPRQRNKSSSSVKRTTSIDVERTVTTRKRSQSGSVSFLNSPPASPSSSSSSSSSSLPSPPPSVTKVSKLKGQAKPSPKTVPKSGAAKAGSEKGGAGSKSEPPVKSKQQEQSKIAASPRRSRSSSLMAGRRKPETTTVSSKPTAKTIKREDRHSSSTSAASRSSSRSGASKKNTIAKKITKKAKATKPRTKKIVPKLKMRPKSKKRMASLNASAILEASFSFEPMEKRAKTPSSPKLSPSKSASPQQPTPAPPRQKSPPKTLEIKDLHSLFQDVKIEIRSGPPPNHSSHTQEKPERKRKSGASQEAFHSPKVVQSTGVSTAAPVQKQRSTSPSKSPRRPSGEGKAGGSSSAPTKEKSTKSSSSKSKSPVPRKKPKVTTAECSTSTPAWNWDPCLPTFSGQGATTLSYDLVEGQKQLQQQEYVPVDTSISAATAPFEHRAQEGAHYYGGSRVGLDPHGAYKYNSSACEAKENHMSLTHYGTGTVYQPAGPLIEPHKTPSSATGVSTGIQLPETVRLPPDLKVTYQTHPPTNSPLIVSSSGSSPSAASSSRHHKQGSQEQGKSSAGATTSKAKSSQSHSASNSKSSSSQSVVLHQPYKTSVSTASTSTATSSSARTSQFPRPYEQQQQQPSPVTNLSIYGSSGTSTSLMAAAGNPSLGQQQQPTMSSHVAMGGHHPTAASVAAASAPGMYYPGFLGPSHHSPFAPSKFPMVPPDSFRNHSPYPTSFLYTQSTPQQNFYMTPFYTPPITPTSSAVVGNGSSVRPVLPSHHSSSAFYQSNPGSALPPPSSHPASNYYVPSPAAHHSIPSQSSPGHAGLFHPNQSSQPACPCPSVSCPPPRSSKFSTSSSSKQSQPPPQPPCATHASLTSAPETSTITQQQQQSLLTSSNTCVPATANVSRPRKEIPHPPAPTTPAVAADPPKAIQYANMDGTQSKQLESAKIFTEQYSLPDDITITPIMVVGGNISAAPPSAAVMGSPASGKTASVNPTINTKASPQKPKDIVHVINPRSGATTTIAKHMSNNSANMSVAGGPKNISSVKPNNAGSVGKIHPDLDVIVLAPGQQPPTHGVIPQGKLQQQQSLLKVNNSPKKSSNANMSPIRSGLQRVDKPVGVSSVQLVQPFPKVPPSVFAPLHNTNTMPASVVEKPRGDISTVVRQSVKRKGIHECIDGLQKKKMLLLEEEEKQFSTKSVINGSDAKLAASAVLRSRRKSGSPTAARALPREEVFEMRNSTIVNEREAVVAASAVVAPHNGSHFRLSPHKNGMKRGRGWNVGLKEMGTGRIKVTTRSSTANAKIKTRSSAKDSPRYVNASKHPAGSGGRVETTADGRSRNRLLRRRVNLRQMPGSYLGSPRVQGGSVQHHLSISTYGRLKNKSSSMSSPGSASSSGSANNQVILRIPRVSGAGDSSSGQSSPFRPTSHERSSLVISRDRLTPTTSDATSSRHRFNDYGSYGGLVSMGSRNIVIGESSGKYRAQIAGSMAFNALKKRAIVKPLSPNLMNGALHSMMMARRQPKWSNGWRFEGEPFQAKVYLTNDDQPVLRRCYPAMRHDGGDVIQARDCVLLKSGPRKTDLPFVAKVAALWENPVDGEMMFSLLWYYRPEHTEIGRTREDMPDEIFASKHRDCNSVATIEDRCFVLTLNEYCRYKKRLKQLEEGITTNLPLVPLSSNNEAHSNLAANIALAVWCGIQGDQRRVPGKVSPEVVFFCRKVYDYRQKRMLKNPS